MEMKAKTRKQLEGNRKWTKVLAKKELLHLSETSGTGRLSLVSLRQNIKVQRENEANYVCPSYCYECRSIARKLGLMDEKGNLTF
jgi:hypothetical protein